MCVVEGEDAHTVWGLALGMVLVKGAGNDPHEAKMRRMSVAETAFIRSTRESVPSHETRSVDARCLIRRRVPANLPRRSAHLQALNAAPGWTPSLGPCY